MSNLDDISDLASLDAAGMLSTIASLGDDCASAYETAFESALSPVGDIDSIVYCGMGGSAVSGDILRAVFAPRLDVPVVVNRGHELPRFAGNRTLVIISSYSGETSETLAAFREAVSRGCKLLAITSGGTLGRETQAAGGQVVLLPGGYQPRAALGHLCFGMLGALDSMGVIPSTDADVDEAVAEIKRLTTQMLVDIPTKTNPAKSLATLIGEKVPVIWGAEGIGAVAAMRWKTQLNENAKVPAFWAAMSELDHNEVVGWTHPYGSTFRLISLRHGGENEEIQRRFELSYEIAEAGGVEIQEVRAGGHSALARLMSLVLVGDFTSTYLGLMRKVDPTPVEVIGRLKSALSDTSD